MFAAPDLWPGVLFWSCSGKSAFAPMGEADRLYVQLRAVFGRGTRAIDKVLSEYAGTRKARHLHRYLHLSDLHFGTQTARTHEAFLLTHLKRIRNRFDRVVITGDLIDSPGAAAYQEFHNFLDRLREVSKGDPIIVTGNHDERKSGISLGAIGRDVSQLAQLNLDSDRVIIDDKARCVFLCFNSSEGGNIARGRISKGQLQVVGDRYAAEALKRPRIDSYIKVAVLHHHPFPYEPSEERRPVSRGFRLLGRGAEAFVGMEDSESFLQWCAERGVSLMMHGHKHIPRLRTESRSARPGNVMLTAVGCGASLGADPGRLSYAIVQWAPDTARWTAHFFSDLGDHSGFHEDVVAPRSTPQAVAV
jgi:3',5'-cyclic AMP phosphodiesterase CpdA